MYRDFQASDRWTRRQLHCLYQALIVSVASRHADAVDIKFLVDGRPVWVVLPLPAWDEYKKRTGKTITDPLAIQIAGRFLKYALESVPGVAEVASAGGFVKEYQVHFSQGYYIQWAGQFEYLKAAESRLAIVVPFTLLIIFFLIYLNTRSIIKTFIVLLAVPFSFCVLLDSKFGIRVGRSENACGKGDSRWCDDFDT